MNSQVLTHVQKISSLGVVHFYFCHSNISHGVRHTGESLRYSSKKKKKTYRCFYNSIQHFLQKSDTMTEA